MVLCWTHFSTAQSANGEKVVVSAPKFVREVIAGDSDA
jgi:hypothetical protein